MCGYKDSRFLKGRALIYFLLVFFFGDLRFTVFLTTFFGAVFFGVFFAAGFLAFVATFF